MRRLLFVLALFVFVCTAFLSLSFIDASSATGKKVGKYKLPVTLVDEKNPEKYIARIVFVGKKKRKIVTITRIKYRLSPADPGSDENNFKIWIPGGKHGFIEYSSPDNLVKDNKWHSYKLSPAFFSTKQTYWIVFLFDKPGTDKTVVRPIAF